jgi:hypothetical protein
MKTVRQFSRVGPCIELGPLIRETDTRFYYRSRQGYEAFVSKKSSLAVHLEPCPSCRDHKKPRSGAILDCYRRAAEARRMADRVTNRLEKEDFLAIEQRWLSLARSYEAQTVRAAPRRAPRAQRKQRGRG